MKLQILCWVLTDERPKMDEKWTKNGQKMDKKWTKNGPKVEQKLNKNGPKNGQNLMPFASQLSILLPIKISNPFHLLSKFT